MYKGVVSVSQAQLHDFLKTAKSLQIQGKLKKMFKSVVVSVNYMSLLSLHYLILIKK